MSSKFAGVTFDEQAATPSDDAIIRRAILDDGILNGCAFSYTGSTLTMTAGQLMICGRQVKHPSTQNWAVADATTGFARLLLTIDLTRTSSKDTFEQVVDTIEYASAVDGFPELVQDDINASGTKYQIVAAVVSLASGGISGIVSQLGQTSVTIGDKSILIVSVPAGSMVTATLGPQIKTAQEKNGEAWLRNLDVGEWNLKLTKGEQTATAKYNIPEFGVYRTSMAFFLSAADFVWGGTKGTDYEIVQDDDTVIPEEDYPKYENWKARILTSIAVTPKRDAEVDVFLLGAGASGASRDSSGSEFGAGGGSGRTGTFKNVKLTANSKYEIEIGAGGPIASGDEAPGKPGGETSAFGHTIEGGGPATIANYRSSGGPGGSGGAGKGGQPGTDGSDGTGERPGTGQGTTTREFGEPDGKLYADGGKFGQSSPGEAIPNSGNGGDGSRGGKSGPGSPGIVVIRNAREVA